MKYFILSVRDRAADVFGVPMFVASIGGAIRSFGDEVNRRAENNAIAAHPEDFDLYKLGTYDDAAASFDILEHPQQIARAQDFTLRASMADTDIAEVTEVRSRLGVRPNS